MWNKNNIDIQGIFLISLRSAWYYGVQRQLYSAWRIKDLEPDFLVINQYIIYFHINLPTRLILIGNWIIKNTKYGDESLSKNDKWSWFGRISYKTKSILLFAYRKTLFENFQHS